MEAAPDYFKVNAAILPGCELTGVKKLVIMQNRARCAVGFCDNDKGYPDLAYVT